MLHRHLLFTAAVAAASAISAVYAEPVPVPATTTAPAFAEGLIDMAKQTEGTTYTFDISEMPLRQAVLEFNKLTHSTMTIQNIYRNGTRTNVLDQNTSLSGKMRFWEGLLKLLGPTAADDGSLNWQMAETNGNTFPFAGRVSTSGAFMVVANRLERNADFQRAPQQIEQFYLQLQVAVEPSMRIISIPPITLPKEAVAGNNDSMVPPAGADLDVNRNDTRSYRREWAATTAVRLTKPAKAGDRIKLVKGTVPVGLVSKMQVLRVSEPGAKSATSNGVTVNLSCKKTSETSTTYTYSVTWDANLAPDVAKTFEERYMNLRLRFLNAAGKEVPNYYGSSGSSNRNMRSMSTTVTPNSTAGDPSLGPPTQAFIEVPVEVKIIDVPYEFTDLPMP